MQSWNLPKKIISGKNLHIFVLCSFSHLNITHTALVCITDIEDRKSTRLNSSPSQISYAVFCLKKTHRKSEGRLQSNYCGERKTSCSCSPPGSDTQHSAPSSILPPISGVPLTPIDTWS